ncbi:MAG: hypothetical protein O9301_01350 [Leptospira sp.]|nr:hypothetical protein [Leptospira sp.]
MNITKAILPIFLTAILLQNPSLSGQTIPKFEIKDQYGQTYSSQNIKSRPVVLLGCHLHDLEVCRKIGRKIYWKMQNLLWKDASKVEFLMYLDLRETNQMVESYIEESKNKQFESILLDRQGQLSTGLKKQEGYLRIFGKSGIEIHSEYLEKISDENIQKIHNILRGEIK